MSAGFLKVLNISLTAGWLVLAVVLLRFALKKAPKWTRCFLWGIVGLRLMLPFTIESRLSLLPSAEPVRTEAVVAVASPDDDFSIGVSERVVVSSGFTAIDNALNPVLTRTSESYSSAEIDPVSAAKKAAGWIWAAGACAMLMYSAASYIHMVRKVRASIETEPGVYVCDEVKSPFILGVIRPKIYLPSGLDERSRRNVLAHERAHIERLDHIWKPLGFVLLSVHWFNPLVWLAFVLFSRDIEFACDEKVISQLDAEGKAEYSLTLLAFSRPQRAIAACPVAFGEVGVKERVRSVLHYKKSAKWIVLIALFAVAAVGVCFLTGPRPVNAAGSETSSRVLPPPDKLLSGAGSYYDPDQNIVDVPEYLYLLPNIARQPDTAE
ncbi:MAG: hypothetical protein J5772_02130 [Clostridia bacterium]|nr:hypothetical protein [Clostridia bacterium]